MESRTAIFASDFHLTTANSKNYIEAISFFKSLKGKIDHLFLLGDVFEFWYNDRKALLEEYADVLSALKELTDAGTKLILFEGNHDISYGSYIKKLLNADIYSHTKTMQLNNFIILVGHGDDLLKGDIKYQFLRFLLRTSLVKFIISSAPSGLVLKIALAIARISRKSNRIFKSEINEIYKKDIVPGKIKEGVDMVILGHTHIPEISEIAGGLFINPGNWIERPSFVEFKDNKFNLRYFSTEKHP